MSTKPLPAVEIIDPEMESIVESTAVFEKVASGMQFTEGPVWLSPGMLVFSDIPADRMYRWAPGACVAVFREPSHNANGNTSDLQGRLLTCEHG